jgi:predicted PurR-regulated permease PerM
MQKTIIKFFTIAGLVALLALLYMLTPIFLPFLISILLAYLFDPLANRLMRFGLPRSLAVTIVFLLIFAGISLVIVLLIPLLQTQIATFIDTVPQIITWLQQNLMPWLHNHLGVPADINLDTLRTTLSENWSKAGGVASGIFATVLHSGFKVLGWTVHLVLIPVVTFYLLRDWDFIMRGIRDLLPRRYESTIVSLAQECDEVLSAFFKGQLLVMLSLGIFYALALSLTGLRLGLLIGIIVGIVTIVPYLGLIVGLSTAMIAAFIQFGTMSSLVLVGVIFIIGQALESMVLTPKLVGDRIGLHPVAVIFAVLAGGVLYGFFGILLALPAAAVIMVLARFVHQRYRRSRYYQDYNDASFHP